MPASDRLKDTNITTKVFSVVGKKRNVGAELFVQGNAPSDTSLTGGVTCIDARLQNTGLASTNDQLVVGVPRVQGDLAPDSPGIRAWFRAYGCSSLRNRPRGDEHKQHLRAGLRNLQSQDVLFGQLLEHHDTFRFQVVNLTNQTYYASVADGNIVGSPGANTAYLGMPLVFMASLDLDY